MSNNYLQKLICQYSSLLKKNHFIMKLYNVAAMTTRQKEEVLNQLPLLLLKSTMKDAKPLPLAVVVGFRVKVSLPCVCYMLSTPRQIRSWW